MLLASFGFFLLVFLLIGFSSVLVRKKESTDYLLAGRNLPPALVGLSAVATNNSGYMFIGVIGYTYATGLSAIWLMVGWIAGDFIASLLIHGKMRATTEAGNALTYPEMLSTWFGQDYTLLRRLVALIAVIFLGSYAAAQFTAGGKALQVLFGWDLNTGAIIGSIMVLFYCFSGGLRASIWTDVAQSLVMIVAMATMTVVVIANRGGIAETWELLHQVSDTHMALFPRDMSFGPLWGPVMFVVGWMFAGFGVVGQPHVMIRFMALEDTRKMWRARAYYYIWFTAFYFLANTVGLVSRLLIPETDFDPELALPTMAKELLHGIPAGLVLAGLFAATISTADSLILSCSAALSRDLPPRTWHNYTLTRYSTLIVIIMALLIALWRPENVFDLVILSWGGLASAFGPLLVVYALGRRPGQAVAILMVLTGFVTAYVWRGLGLHGDTFEGLPAMAASWVVFLVGTVVEKKVAEKR